MMTAGEWLRHAPGAALGRVGAIGDIAIPRAQPVKLPIYLRDE